MRYIKILIPLFFLVAVLGCEKTETFDNTSTEVGHSRVIFFPTVAIKGTETIILEKGGTFTDPGAIAKVGDAEVPYTTAGTVNTNVAGVYQLIYTAENAEGFTSSASRRVVVYSTDAGAAANDLSGSYARSTNGSIAVWTKVAPGVYSVFNPGGAPGTNLTVYVFNSTGFTIKIPTQPASDGSPITSAQEVYTNGAVPTYTWQILNQGYGTGLRTFNKI